MEFVSVTEDHTYLITCPYCLDEFPYDDNETPTDTISCKSCMRPVRFPPTSTHAFGAPATDSQQSEYLRGQHHAYTFGYAAVASPIVLHVSPRLWLIGRWLILANLLLAAAVVWLNPASPVSLAVLGLSYTFALAFIMVRIFLWGSLRIMMSNDVRFRDVIRHHYAFEQGYWESVNEGSKYAEAALRWK